VALSNPPSNVKEKNQAQKSPLSIYQDEFETRLLESTSQYYSRESTLFLSQNDVASYLRKVCTSGECYLRLSHTNRAAVEAMRPLMPSVPFIARIPLALIAAKCIWLAGIAEIAHACSCNSRRRRDWARRMSARGNSSTAAPMTRCVDTLCASDWLPLEWPQ
jgi:hypothetical protein